MAALSSPREAAYDLSLDRRALTRVDGHDPHRVRGVAAERMLLAFVGDSDQPLCGLAS